MLISSTFDELANETEMNFANFKTNFIKNKF